MEANVGLLPDELAVIFGPDKYQEELWPLILAVVKKVSVHPKLRAEINKLFINTDLQLDDAVRRKELNTALTALQNKVMEIKLRNENRPPRRHLREAFTSYAPPKPTTGGRKRRRTKKRKHYKKRRSTKHR